WNTTKIPMARSKFPNRSGRIWAGKKSSRVTNPSARALSARAKKSRERVRYSIRLTSLLTTVDPTAASPDTNERLPPLRDRHTPPAPTFFFVGWPPYDRPPLLEKPGLKKPLTRAFGARSRYNH